MPIKDLNPEFIRLLSLSEAWSALQIPLSNKDDEDRRLGELLILQEVINQAKSDVALRTALKAGETVEKKAEVKETVVSEAVKQAIQKINGLYDEPSMKPIFHSVYKKVFALAEYYFKKTERTSLDLALYIDSLRAKRTKFLSSLPEGHLEYQKEELIRFCPLLKIDGVNESQKEEFIRLCQLFIVQGVLEEAVINYTVKVALLERHTSLPSAKPVIDAISKSLKKFEKEFKDLKKILGSQFINAIDAISDSSRNMAFSLVKPFFEKNADLIIALYIDKLRLRIQPEFIKLLPDDLIKTPLHCKKDELYRYCKLLILERLFYLAQNNENLKKELLAGKHGVGVDHVNNAINKAMSTLSPGFIQSSIKLFTEEDFKKAVYDKAFVIATPYFSALSASPILSAPAAMPQAQATPQAAAMLPTAALPQVAPIPPTAAKSQAASDETVKLPKLSGTHYPYQIASNNGRYHVFEVKPFNLPKKYDNTEGDYLKSLILLDFKEAIEQATTKQELKQVTNQLKGSHKYQILAYSQGLLTSILPLKTSSEKAFEKMVEEQQRNIQNRLISTTHYEYQVESDEDKRKYHFFEVKQNKDLTKPHKNLKQVYKGKSGDALKSAILLNFKKQMERFTSRAELMDWVEALEKDNAEYNVLKEAQGFTTWFFSWKTSSIKAFETMVAERLLKITEPQIDKKPPVNLK